MRRILYLTDQPLDQRNYDRFGVQAWIDRGWEVRVWDVTPLAHPRVWSEHMRLGGGLKEFSGYQPIASRTQLEQAFARLDGIDHFIDFTGDYSFSARLKRRLVRMGVARVTCSTGSIPEPDDGVRSGVGRKLGKAIAAGPLRALQLLGNSITRKLAAAVIAPGVRVVSGAKSAAGDHKGIQFIAAHNLDYDIYLRIRDSAVKYERPYAVFIDQDYCFHLEYIYQGVPAVVTPEKYFPAICASLRAIAQALDLDVRIAAHPRAAYRQRSRDYFEGFPIEYGRTAELIRDCALVVCHDSTAIQLAVLFNKPVIFVTTGELDRVFFDSALKRESIERFAAELGKSVINVDEDLRQVDWRQAATIDRGKYAEYRNKYVKLDGSPEIPYWQIVIDHFEKHSRRPVGMRTL